MKEEEADASCFYDNSILTTVGCTMDRDLCGLLHVCFVFDFRTSDVGDDLIQTRQKYGEYYHFGKRKRATVTYLFTVFTTTR